MKRSFFLAFLSVASLVAPVERTGAQTPFTSTSPPNSNPFGNGSTGSGFGPLSRPSQQSPPVGAPGSPGYGQPLGYPVAAPVYSSGAIDPDHRLGRGDHLSFRVQEDRDDKVTPLIVTDSGEMDVPYLGRIKAAGKSTTQLTAEIKGALEREYYYHATVIMGLDAVAQESSAGRVYVTGAVRAPGAFDLPAGTTMTVSQAVVQVSGFTDFANRRKVKVIRKTGPKDGIIVDVKAVQDGKPDKDVVLQPGDIINVPEKIINMF